jgi:hypothetical protein
VSQPSTISRGVREVVDASRCLPLGGSPTHRLLYSVGPRGGDTKPKGALRAFVEARW